MRSRGGAAGPKASADPRRHAGISIVEVLVALVLLAVGLLGIAGSGAIAMRASSSATRERRAAQRAADRAETLRADGCTAARSGSYADSGAALDERWIVGAATGGAALIDVEVRWRSPSGVRAMLLRSAILC